MSKNISIALCRKTFPILLIVVFLFLIYSNSFHAEWHMDDRPNIVNNRALHLQDLMPGNIWKTFFANQGREEPKLFRPLACLTFAINWYIGQDNTFGYHVVNYGFHTATAVALYFLMIRLLALLKRPDGNEITYIQNVALIAAILWAINPIQVQAVTYIVQRMSVMAAFFTVLSMTYYVKARTVPSTRISWSYAALCLLWFLCALGSKENAIMLPVLLVLIEWVFFQKGRTDFLKWSTTWFVSTGLILVILVCIFVYFGGSPLEGIRSWYSSRPFSFEERLLAQPRIVIHYLSQIFYPVPDRFSIAHDIMISDSLFFPWTTLPAIIAVSLLILGSLTVAKRYPLLSFAVLFFFINHAIESFVIPLELIFEHRNYLPSLFIFLPIAAGFYSLLLKIWKENHLISILLAAAMVLFINSVGLSTYTRNKAWATGTTLWTDAAQKAPNQIRPLVTLGIKLAWKDKPSDYEYDLALALFQRALELPEANRKNEKAEILGNIASIYFHRGENEKAIETYLEAVELNPAFLKTRFDIINPLILTGNFEEAEHHARYLLNERPTNHIYLTTMGFIYLWQDKPDKAILYFQRALAFGPPRTVLLFNTGVALTRLDSWENAKWFLKMTIKRSPEDLLPLLAIIENRSRAGDYGMATAFARYTVNTFPTSVIYHTLSRTYNAYHSAPISPQYILKHIENALKNSIT